MNNMKYKKRISPGAAGKTPKGSKQLRYLLCEAANAASKTECQFKHKYKSLMIRRGHKKAIVAVGHKM